MQTPQYTIKPLFNQFLFRRVDLGNTGDLIIPDGASGKIPAALVLDVGPDCHSIAVGDNVILAEGVSFSGYPGPDGAVVHLINEQCVVAKYVPVPCPTLLS